MTNNQITITKHNFNLEERTLEFAKEVIRLCKRLPQNTINRELISQLIRASGSIGANYREGNDALSKKDFVYRIRIVRKEANNDFVEEIEKLITESFELKKIFSSIAEKSS